MLIDDFVSGRLSAEEESRFRDQCSRSPQLNREVAEFRTLLAGLAIGLGMAIFSTRHILRLEASSQLRYEEAAESRKQLTNLSAKLVHAQELERRTLSIELHDEVGQALSAALVELRNLAIRLEAQSPAAWRTRQAPPSGRIALTPAPVLTSPPRARISRTSASQTRG